AGRGSCSPSSLACPRRECCLEGSPSRHPPSAGSTADPLRFASLDHSDANHRECSPKMVEWPQAEMSDGEDILPPCYLLEGPASHRTTSSSRRPQTRVRRPRDRDTPGWPSLCTTAECGAVKAG